MKGWICDGIGVGRWVGSSRQGRGPATIPTKNEQTNARTFEAPALLLLAEFLHGDVVEELRQLVGLLVGAALRCSRWAGDNTISFGGIKCLEYVPSQPVS